MFAGAICLLAISFSDADLRERLLSTQWWSSYVEQVMAAVRQLACSGSPLVVAVIPVGPITQVEQAEMQAVVDSCVKDLSSDKLQEKKTNITIAHSYALDVVKTAMGNTLCIRCFSRTSTLVEALKPRACVGIRTPTSSSPVVRCMAVGLPDLRAVLPGFLRVVRFYYVAPAFFFGTANFGFEW